MLFPFRRSCGRLVLAIVAALAATTANAQQEFAYEIVSTFQVAEGRPKALIQTRDGRFFGTSSKGVFTMDTNGARTTVYTFPANSPSGQFIGMPGGLVEGGDGSVYGTTLVASAFVGAPGQIFRLGLDGVVTTVASRYLLAGIMQARDGRLYGTAAADTTPFSEAPGFVFRVEADGTLTSLYSSDLLNPSAGVVEGADGSLFGPSAGLNRYPSPPSSRGDVFQLIPNPATGGFAGTTHHTFTGPDGSLPTGTLIHARDGLIYGTTLQGGAFGYGTVFSLDAAGTHTTVHHFTGADGAFPEAGVIEGLDGRLYGTTTHGGAFDRGTVFALNVTGGLTTLHSFAFSDGADPVDELIQTDDGTLYGVAPMGGPGNSGVIFRLRSTTSTTDTPVEIVSRHSGKCLTVAGGSTDPGASAIQMSCVGVAHQQWRLEPAGGGAFRIIARHSGQALDVSGGSTADGAPLLQWPVHGGDNQAWTLEPAPDGHVRPVVRHSGKAMDVEFGSTGDGARVLQWSPHDGPNQQWLLRPVESAALESRR